MKLFIDDTAWLHLLDSSSRFHEQINNEFSYALNNGHRLFTHNIIIGMALSEIKKKLGDNIAGKFHETIEEAYTGTHLKILWIGRRTQKEAVRQMRRNATISLHVYDFASFVLMNKRRIHSILTTKSGFNELGLKVIPQLGE